MLTLLPRPRQAAVLARFTQQLLSVREYLSSKALHLFLQTGLSIEKIRLNIMGLRDDDVPSNPLVDKRKLEKLEKWIFPNIWRSVIMINC